MTDKPSKPRNLETSDKGRDHVVLTWKAPEDDGGASLLGYVVEKRVEGMRGWSKVGETGPDSLRYRVGRLEDGTTYEFRVAAENNIGVGPFAELDEQVKTGLGFGEYLIIACTFIVNIITIIVEQFFRCPI